MRISLNQLDWKLQGYWPFEPLLKLSAETGHRFQGVTESIPATVPGSVHHDLLRAGLIEDPYFERNSLKCEWVENRWWVYSAAFQVPAEHDGKAIRLVFQGIDYRAHVFLNGKKLGEHEGMFTPAIFDVSEAVDFGGDNQLRIAIESAPPEMSQIGFTSRTRTQKSRFNYKWDFSTRLVNLGLWDDVCLEITGGARIIEHQIATDVKDGKGLIEVALKMDVRHAAKASIRIFSDDAVVAEPYPWTYPDKPANKRCVNLFPLRSRNYGFRTGSGPRASLPPRTHPGRGSFGFRFPHRAGWSAQSQLQPK